ncbi:hypothetical protein AMS68_000376 [Peltaster fructicola]|uniref:ADF-H domain-containing protein n=1 Tax=Peltaster fructicola TaxID=286661 RepID=A0A6H0XJP4_9PEZI|nr:hypothetical protein AMS68_000376 [Peltaster fructicola]
MSLNGLDTPEVQEAHQTAVAEPGGWFLLKYISRDSVELHGRGKGGVHEARLAIAKYQDASPLYGLLIYRRRKVLIKYIPVGTSRVLQARTAVHFQDVVEHYSPYETLLEITNADGLNDTSLAASFPLHTASLSASATRLHEISEDAEDSGASPRRPTGQNQESGSIFGTRQYKIEKRVDQIMRADRAPPSILGAGGDAASIASSTLSPGKTSIASQILVREDSGKRSITSLSSPLSESMTSYGAASGSSLAKDSESRSSLASEASRSRPSATMQRPGTQGSNHTASGVEPLLEESSLSMPDKLSSSPDAPVSSQSQRMKEALEEPYDFSYLEPKQKVRLAPRPVAAKRATTSGVSALPAHYRPQPKKQETAPTYLSGFTPLQPPPIPAAAEYDPRPISRGSVKSLPSQRGSSMTADKIRLMKAVELRKRQLRKSNPQLPTIVPGLSPDAPNVPRIPEQIPEQPKQELKETRLDQLQHAAREDTNKSDSGIQMDYQKPESKPDETDSGAETKPSGDAAPEDPGVVEALLNDEAKAEAEGYGAVPAEVKETEQPKLPSYGTPRTPTRPDMDFTPSSAYSDAADYPEAVVQAAQNATLALNRSTVDDSAEDTAVPTITMSPGTPMQARHPAAFTDMMTSKHTEEDEEEELDLSDDEQTPSNDLDVQSSPRRQNSDLAKRRRGVVEPLHLETQAELLSDDELMDELQEAVVHEARPIQVARSPVNEYFPRRPSNISLVSAQSKTSDHSVPRFQASRQPSRDKMTDEPETQEGLAQPLQMVRRSVSPMNSIDTFSGIKRNVSSGITKRFQALTENHREPIGTPTTLSPAQSREGSPKEKRIKSPPRARAGSVNRRWGLGERGSSTTSVTSNSENIPVWSVSQDSTGNRDSIHVRARIVRPASSLDTHNEKPDSEDAAGLQQSKLEINHSVAKPLPPLSTAYSSLESRSTSSPVSRRNKNLSITTPITAQPEDFPVPPSNRGVTSPIVDDAPYSMSSSRTSRFFKRMSSLGGGNKRRSATTQNAASSQADSAAASVKSLRTTSTITEKDRSDMPPAAALGDLNVQFPDTLLWKRRWLSLDEAGSLVIGIPQSMEHHKSSVPKKHHLAEFKLPYMPDLDRQEMPHSICLDFNEGGTFQIACEDAMGQRHVLNMLRNYWKSWVG